MVPNTDGEESDEMTRGSRRWLAAAMVGALAVTGCARIPLDGPSSATTRPSTAGTTVGERSPRPTAPAASPTGSTTAQHRAATLVFSGDLLWHDSVWLSAADDHRRTGKGDTYDFDPMFAAMKPVISSADLAVCHEEVPFAKLGQAPVGYPTFRAPRQIAAWIPTMGWDACTTASNHSIDQGFSGLKDTYDLLRQHGVQPVGTFPTAAARATPVILTTRQGVRIGLVSGTYATNGIPLPKGREWSLSMWDADNLLAQAHRARQAGADFVVVSMHGGDEYQTAPNQAQRELVRRLTASSDVDLVVGEHVHVVQPITRVNHTWVVYGMGNLVAQHLTDVPRGYEGITVRFTVAERSGGGFEVSRAEYIPTLVTHYSPGHPVRILPVVPSLASGTGDRARLQVALQRTRQAVHSMGGDEGLSEG
ncbi:CapA family protein [Aestuariimicrobium kwangyangense]|uniref:CapA family protein n=1 Tax=Aestuariimicrobium kwangyangense TaxID=396389 RepID=UPI0003B3C398|nr:CapA family protein [Aestuariimicrobium kwangyangense]